VALPEYRIRIANFEVFQEIITTNLKKEKKEKKKEDYPRYNRNFKDATKYTILHEE
jgi:hypothetical protein